MITQERLKQLVSYDARTGEFTRIFATTHNAKTTSISGDGYYRITLDNKRYRAHRLAWLYVYGKMPAQIDHINQDKLDNRISNLRIATHSENGQNIRHPNKNNSLKIRGVRKHALCDKYQARIKINYKEVYLGLFETKEDAYQAYLDAKKKFHPASTVCHN